MSTRRGADGGDAVVGERAVLVGALKDGVHRVALRHLVLRYRAEFAMGRRSVEVSIEDGVPRLDGVVGEVRGVAETVSGGSGSSARGERAT